MKRYFLVICSGDSTDSPSKCVYKKVLEKYCSFKHQFDGSQRFSSVHHAILLTSSADEKNDDHKFLWRKLEEEEAVCSLDDEEVRCHISQLPEAIHAFLDQLPVYGNYLLDIFIDGDFFNLLSSDEGEIETFGALLRCVLWHNGLVTSVHRTKILTHKWANYLRSSEITVQDDVPAVGWRGNLRFGITDSPSATVIPGLQLSWHWREPMSFEISSIKDCKEMEHIIISNEIQVLEEISVMCLPAYLYSTVKYQLSIPNACHGCEAAKEFFKYLQSNAEIGFIAKLSYETFHSCKGLASLPLPKTEDWKNAVLNSDLKDLPKIPELQLENSQSIHFLIFWDDSCPPSSAWAHQLRHPSELDTSFCSEKNFDSAEIIPSKDVTRHFQNLLKDLPHFTPKALNRLQNLIRELQSQADIVDSKLGVENEEIPSLESKFSEFETEFQSCFKSGKVLGICLPSEELSKELLIDIDPSDWPERRYLLLRSFKEKTNDTIADPQQINDFEAADVLNLFNSSGEGIMKDSTNVPGQKIRSIKPRNSLDEALQSSWPDVIHCHYHDIYYNASDVDERKEHACNLTREQCILNETESTCTVERQYTQVILRPSKRKRNASEVVLRRSPRRLALKASFCNTAENREENMPLRRSPRKHITQQLHESSQVKKSKVTENKQFNKGSRKTDQKDLSELHKKKLREAVVVALETEGISMDHAIFKSCGRRLFNVCKAFVSDVIGSGSTSMLMKKIANAHVKQVIEFENLKKETKCAR